MAEVAARAGVSVTTVSHVLNDVPGKRIPPATGQRVRDAAADLGYVVNELARSLRLQRTHVLAFISDEVLITPFAAAMVHGALEAAAELGWTVVLTNTGVDRTFEAEQIHALSQRQIDGFLYVRMYNQEVTLPRGLPDDSTVIVDATCSDARIASVVPDEYSGGVSAARELLDHGHTKIGFINNADDICASRERLRGLRSALAEAGVALPDDYLAVAPSDAAGGRRAGRALLDLPDRPEAIFCFNDRMAMGVYQAAHERGLAIPADLSVVGFDNQIMVADALLPGLTTLELPHYEMGAWGVRTLIDQLNGSGKRHPPRVAMPCPLITRGSVAAPTTARRDRSVRHSRRQPAPRRTDATWSSSPPAAP
jgi:LacI family transcriptional regulator